MKTISIAKNLFLSLTILCAFHSIHGAQVSIGAGDPAQSIQAQKAAKKKAAQKKKDKRKKENKKLKGQGAEINKSILADKEAILESVKHDGSQQDVINSFFTFIMLEEVDSLEQLKKIAKDRGFDLVNTCNEGNIAPLIYAVDMEKFKSVKWLVRNGADLDIINNDGDTAEVIAKRNLSIALADNEDQAIQTNEEIVQEIELARLRLHKEVGADIKKTIPSQADVKSASKLKPSESHLDLPSAAIGHGAGAIDLSEKERALMQGLGVHSVAELAKIPSCVAELVRHNLTHLLEQTIQAGANIEECDMHGYTPFMIAAKLGNETAAQILLTHRARTDITYKPIFSKSIDPKYLKKDQNKTALQIISSPKPEAGINGLYFGKYDIIAKKIEKAEKERKKTERKQDSTTQDAEKAKQIAKQREYEEQRKAIKAQKLAQKEEERKKAAQEVAQKVAQEEKKRAEAAALLRQKETEKEQQRKEKELKEAQEREQIRARLEQERKEREAKEKEAERLKDEQMQREKQEKERKEREAAEQVRLKTAYSQAAGDAAREAREKERQEGLMDEQAQAQHLQGLRQDVAEVNAIYADVAKRSQKIIEREQELSRGQQLKQAMERERERKKMAEREAEWARLQDEAERDKEDIQLDADLFKRLEQEREKEYQEQERQKTAEKARQEKIRLEQERKEREAKKARDHQINEELLRLRAQRQTQKRQQEADVTRAHEEKLKKAKELLLNGAITGDLVKIGLALKIDKHCINAVDNGGNTALMLAISFGHKQVINFFLDLGITVDAQKNIQGRSTFDLVCLYNAQFDYADLLKREPFVKEWQAKKQREEAEKHEAERMRIEQENKQKKEAEARLKAKFDTNGHLMLEKCENLQDAIESAITFTQNGKGIKYDESARNDIAQQVKKAWIFEAINRGSIDELRVSIAAGADLNNWSDDDNGDTPVILAINKGRTDLVEILLGAGANARAENRVGATPFQAAARHARTTRSMDLLKVVQKSLGALTAEESSVLMSTLESVATLAQRYSSAGPSPLSPVHQSGVSSPVPFIPVSGAGGATPSNVSPHYPLSQSSSQTFSAAPSPMHAMGAGIARPESKRQW